MGRPKKAPKLRIVRDKYYCTDIYLPTGKRSTIGFGTNDVRTEGEIFVAFGKWLDLYHEQPHKVLSYDDPYEAVSQILNPTKLVTVGELLEKYHVFRSRAVSKDHTDFVFLNRLKQFLEPYNKWPISDFGPDELYDIQHALLDHRYKQGAKWKRYTRRGINDTIHWIHQVWKWGLGRQFVTVEHVQGLAEVKPIKMGYKDVPDNPKRVRITETEFWQVVDQLSSVVGDMLKLIWYTAMRPYEICNMRPNDILRQDPQCWLYIPGRDETPFGKHKTTRFERARVIPLTEECQNILNPRINGFDSKEYIFSPKEAMAEFLQKKSTHRKTPLKYGNRPGTNQKEHPMIKPGKKYDHQALRHACKRACKRAGVDEFVPYDLRRTAATGTRSILGKEAAKVLLGHAKIDTTEIYLLDEVQEAIKVAKLLSAKTHLK